MKTKVSFLWYPQVKTQVEWLSPKNCFHCHLWPKKRKNWPKIAFFCIFCKNQRKITNQIHGKDLIFGQWPSSDIYWDRLLHMGLSMFILEKLLAFYLAKKSKNHVFWRFFSILLAKVSSVLPVLEGNLSWTIGLLPLTICDAHGKPNWPPRGSEIGSKWTKLCIFWSFFQFCHP